MSGIVGTKRTRSATGEPSTRAPRTRRRTTNDVNNAEALPENAFIEQAQPKNQGNNGDGQHGGAPSNPDLAAFLNAQLPDSLPDALKGAAHVAGQIAGQMAAGNPMAALAEAALPAIAQAVAPVATQMATKAVKKLATKVAEPVVSTVTNAMTGRPPAAPKAPTAPNNPYAGSGLINSLSTLGMPHNPLSQAFNPDKLLHLAKQIPAFVAQVAAQQAPVLIAAAAQQGGASLLQRRGAARTMAPTTTATTNTKSDEIKNMLAIGLQAALPVAQRVRDNLPLAAKAATLVKALA